MAGSNLRFAFAIWPCYSASTPRKNRNGMGSGLVLATSYTVLYLTHLVRSTRYSNSNQIR